MIPARLTVCLLVAAVLASELVPTADANLATIQASWKAMKRRMRQKQRMIMPNLIGVRRLPKRIVSGMHLNFELMFWRIQQVTFPKAVEELCYFKMFIMALEVKSDHSGKMIFV